MRELINKFIRDEEGQDLVEYALLLVFLALAAIAVLPTLGSSVNRVFSQSNSSLNASYAQTVDTLISSLPPLPSASLCPDRARLQHTRIQRPGKEEEENQ